MKKKFDKTLNLTVILHEKLWPLVYKLENFQGFLPKDFLKHSEFAFEILNRIDIENDYLNHICFSDESTFYVSGTVNKHVYIRTRESNVSLQLQLESPKVYAWCD